MLILGKFSLIFFLTEMLEYLKILWKLSAIANQKKINN